jgi:hypothetical protein
MTGIPAALTLIVIKEGTEFDVPFVMRVQLEVQPLRNRER